MGPLKNPRHENFVRAVFEGKTAKQAYRIAVSQTCTETTAETAGCDLLTIPRINGRLEELKNTPILAARQEVIKGIKANPEFSLKFLERRKSDEFAPRQKIDHSGIADQGFNIPPEDEDRYKKEIDNLRKGATTK